MPLRLRVVAKPGKQNASIIVRDDGLVVAVRERAVDGRANAAIERAIAAWLDIRGVTVTIVGGASSRHKYVEIAGPDEAAVRARIEAARDAM